MSEHWSGGIYTKPVNARTHILLTRESLNDDWSLPGGTQEENESPLETFAREIEEEIGCIAETNLLISKIREPEHMRYIFDIEPKTEIKESETVKFYALIRLPRNLRERHRQILDCLYKNLIKTERKLSQPLSLAA